MLFIEDLNDPGGGDAPKRVEKRLRKKVCMFAEGHTPRLVVSGHRVCQSAVAVKDKRVELGFGKRRPPVGLYGHERDDREAVLKLQKNAPNRPRGRLLGWRKWFEICSVHGYRSDGLKGGAYLLGFSDDHDEGVVGVKMGLRRFLEKFG